MSYINFISKMQDVNRKPLEKIVEFDELYKLHFKENVFFLLFLINFYIAFIYSC